MAESNHKQKGYLCIIMAAILWGFIGPFGKVAYSQGMGSLEVAFWRAVFAWCCFSGEILIKRESIHVARKEFFPLALFSVLCVALLYGAYQIAVDKGGAALASVLLYTAPAWVILLSKVILQEKITKTKLIALSLTLGGITCITLSQADEIPSGNIALASGGIIAGLLSGFCYSLYYILGKFFSEKYSASVLFFYTLLPGALLLTPWFSFTEKTGMAWLSLVLLAVFSTYGAYHFYYAGLKYIEAGKASLIATLEPVVASLVAWYWWGEIFSLTGYLGTLLIISAVILIVKK
jgi:drug/metabolite transporter (DMT)-like permease